MRAKRIAADFSSGGRGVTCSMSRRHLGSEVLIDILLKRLSDGSQPNARRLARTIHAHCVVCKKRHHGSDVPPVSSVNGLAKDCDRIILGEPHEWEHRDARGEKYY